MGTKNEKRVGRTFENRKKNGKRRGLQRRRRHLRPPPVSIGEDECERREKRASLSREKIERERKEKMRDFLPTALI